DPKVERKNLKEFLEKPDIHWDGYKLTPEILDPIRKILKLVTANNN
ncbi:XRE family transcriptional regulator, partial [Xanthomonas citri pv. citri]|nr:XRE family transcriptional regulator [Xanthomonas citri pv. citri]